MKPFQSFISTFRTFCQSCCHLKKMVFMQTLNIILGQMICVSTFSTFQAHLNNTDNMLILNTIIMLIHFNTVKSLIEMIFRRTFSS